MTASAELPKTFGLSQVLQVSFLLASSTVLFLNSFHPFRSRFITYGPRATPAEASDADGENEPNRKEVALLNKLLDSLASMKVPHGYFLHFYIVSVVSSLFWGIQIMMRGSILKGLIDCEPTGSGKAMPMERIIVTWALMTAQGVRRLLESATFAKPSASKMWFVHWLLGIAFYTGLGVAVYIEGAKTLRSTTPILTFSAPSLRTLLFVPLFLLASGIQHNCHAYLASLPKYTLPTHPVFQNLICPHYNMECLIYLSLAFLATPEGAWINRTILTGLVFVSVNLGVTASTSKEWYENKFGKEKVAGRWKMVPFIF